MGGEGGGRVSRQLTQERVTGDTVQEKVSNLFQWNFVKNIFFQFMYKMFAASCMHTETYRINFLHSFWVESKLSGSVVVCEDNQPYLTGIKLGCWPPRRDKWKMIKNLYRMESLIYGTPQLYWMVTLLETFWVYIEWLKLLMTSEK